MTAAPVSAELTAELLDVALAAAQRGADVLAAGARGALQITTKGEDGNLVTDVDVAAERAVRAVIEARRPDDEVTGEELPSTGPDRRRAAVRWSIDPLDGTTNFTRAIPYYATCVGVADADGRWLAGAVVAPALAKTYFAHRGGGAWLAEPNGVRRLTGPAVEPGARLLGMGYSYSADVRAQQFAAAAGHMAGYTDARILGSAALAICAVAEGALDGFVEPDLAEHDWAAAAVIAEEAGLQVNRPSPDSTELQVYRR
ncbi:inositol monophosphatase [Mycolicibacterium anyangense]|uniref:Inositol monophosphatase n=1 Tax=Mycolicibacterium anyangense TaxID=1431246 RepID=A0A6N4W560_9MYCO|nr:inositol monophosphatase family protein [Mycolicibacterium anyangense]BBZ75658.1 inositol monophosphatase [Mycolicibacterium anyangense]